MARATDLPIYRDAYELLLLITKLAQQYPPVSPIRQGQDAPKRLAETGVGTQRKPVAKLQQLHRTVAARRKSCSNRRVVPIRPASWAVC